MKTYLVTSLRMGLTVLLALITSPGFAGQELRKVPVDQTGNTVRNINVSGVKVLQHKNTVTAALVSGSAGVLYGAYLSSGPATTEFVLFRDSGTANDTSDPFIPAVFYESTSKGTLWTPAQPIRFTNGLVVDLSTAPGAGVNGAGVAVFYTKDSD